MSRIKRMLKVVRYQKYSFQITCDIFSESNRMKMRTEQDYSLVVKAQATQA